MSSGTAAAVSAKKVAYLRPETQERLRATRQHPAETDDLLILRLLDVYERREKGQEARSAS